MIHGLEYFSLEDMIAFTEWCNHPVYRLSGDLAFKKRVTPQFPEYNTYMVNDENGKSIFPKGKFLTTEELIELWKIQKNVTNVGKNLPLFTTQ